MTTPSASLHLLPLYEYQDQKCDERTLQRIVTKSPNPDLKSIDTEIEILLLESTTGKRRVLIKGSNTTHISLQLSNSDGADNLDHVNDQLLCWTFFADKPEIQLLCILSCPTMVTLFDVYGQDSVAGGEGHQIYLPCEARSVFSLPSGGLLIQRKETPEDALVDEEFILQDLPTMESSSLTSLFSIEHALDPALPVTTHSNHCVDVMEKILWVSAVSWVGNTSTRTICVSYNPQSTRHTIWCIHVAPPPPPSRPLWELSASSPVEVVADTALLVDRENPVYSPHITRNEALADALGVARRNRPTVTKESMELPSNPLHPSKCLQRIYEESTDSPRTEKIFLATSMDRKSTLLCFFANQELKFISLDVSEDQSITVTCLASQSCLAAEPIKAFPLSSREWATDIFVVTKEKQLVLFCGNVPMLPCSFLQGQPVLSVNHSVSNRVDVVDYESRQFRMCLSCQLDSSTLSERALVAIETALFTAGFYDLSRRIRMDCLTLAQSSNSSEDKVWATFLQYLMLLSGANVESAFATHHSAFERNETPSQWELLMSSDFHMNYMNDQMYICPQSENALESRSRDINAASSLAQLSSKNYSLIGRVIFDTMHLLYEESKLYGSMDWQRRIGKFLISLCLSDSKGTIMAKFLQHYQWDLCQEFTKSILPNPSVPPERDIRLADFTTFSDPPCLFSSIEQLILQSTIGTTRGCVDMFLGGKSADILASDAFPKLRVVWRAFSALFNSSVSHQVRVLDAVKVLIDEGYNDINSLEDNFPVGIAMPLLEALLYCRQEPDLLSELSNSLPVATWKLIGREDVMQKVSGANLDEKNTYGPIEGLNSLDTDEDNDGIGSMEYKCQFHFPHDNRLHEVGRLLRSSRPTFLKINRTVEISDHDFERMKQERLLILCRRVQALPLGRGMYTFGSLEPIPAEPLQVPTLCLSGRIPPNNATLVLDTEALNCPKNMTVWPEFHNGVAAGLRLPLALDDCSGNSPTITRAWIVSNRSAVKLIQPHRNQLNNQSNNESAESDKKPNHAHGGLLMALGLRGHLSALSMTDIYEYLTQGSVTTSVGILLGMSANKRGSCDPAVSKMLCLHIPSLLPVSFSSIDVCGPAHSAAVTGIGLLYQGSSHRLMTEFLLNEMGRHPNQDTNSADREAYVLSCGLALGMVNLARGDSTENLGGGNAGLADLDIELRLNRYVVGGMDSKEEKYRYDTVDGIISGNNDGERCSRIHEGDTTNNDVTAPGATLALGLMYLKSGNKAVASSLALPDTHFLLEYVRPDFLLLRVIARAMILWDTVEPTSEWINEQIPLVIRVSYIKLDESSLRESELVSLQHNVDEMISEDEKKIECKDNPAQDIDKGAVRKIHEFIIAGACFGIGLRFAGTGNQKAAYAIKKRILALIAIRDGSNSSTHSLRPETPVLEMCLSLCSISISLVMAGTGDLDTLRLLKILRWKCSNDIKYGNHMSYNAAIGLLFLGGGTHTLGRCNHDIAALVIAFFPRSPAKTSDNHYHLQALRHFYALAANERIIRAIDIDTGGTVSVPIQLHYKSSTVSKIIDTPCLLLNSDKTVSHLSVASDLYYPSHFNVEIDSRQAASLFVKKRIMEYCPQPEKTSLVRTATVVEALKSASSGIVRNLCQLTLGGNRSTNGNNRSIRFYAELMRCLESGSSSSRALWNIRLVKAYYENMNQRERLMNEKEVARLIEELEKKLKESKQNHLLSISAWLGHGIKQAVDVS